jgi:hypothetical protein
MRQIERSLGALFLGALLSTPCAAATIRGTVTDASLGNPAAFTLTDFELGTFGTAGPGATRVIDYEPNPTFGLASRARDPRQVQFGLKLVF